MKLLLLLPIFALLCACGAEPPAPRTMEEFMADRVSLDATLSRCNSKGSESELEVRECNNAQRAVERLWRQREIELVEERKKQFDAKREALRLRQEREDALRRAREAEERARALDVYGDQYFAESTEGGDGQVAIAEDSPVAAKPFEWTGAAADATPAHPQPDKAQSGTAINSERGSDLEERIRRLEDELRRRRLEAEQSAGDNAVDAGN